MKIKVFVEPSFSSSLGSLLSDFYLYVNFQESGSPNEMEVVMLRLITPIVKLYTGKVVRYQATFFINQKV